MGRNPAWLNQKQAEVLRWVEDGCPNGDAETGYEQRITARALARRGLIAIKGRGPSWSAAITAAGHAWLSAHPSPPPTEAAVASLVRQVQADGRLVLPDDREVEITHEQLVKMSEHSASRPRGWRLEMRATGPWGERRQEIVLVRYFDELVGEIPVPVPSQVPRRHPAVKAFLADRGREAVSKGQLIRAARILQAIVDEAPRRGLVLVSEAQATIGADSYRSREISRGHVILGSSAGNYAIRILEVSARSSAQSVEPRGSDKRRTRATWLDARTPGLVASGILELVVEGPGTGYSGDRYRDAKTISVEAKLPSVFRDLEIHRLEAELRDQQRQREAADRQRRWEAAMIEARRRYDEKTRWDDFQRRSREWHSIAAQREFLTAVRGAVGSYSGPRGDDLLAHLDFAERRLDESDPIKHLELLLPDVSDPKPDDLKPFLNGWSPHGPSGF